jgi:2,3-dihydroxyphenylpropionate 1,2-dioxygenase
LPVIPVNINCQGPPLTPLHRAWAFGEALRRAADKLPARIALVGTGGISHWPATPNSGKINEEWDREFLRRWTRNDRAALTGYSDEETLRDAGQGGFEIRTLIAVAGACEGHGGEIWFCEPIPIFATSGFAGVMNLSTVSAAKAA